MKRAYFRGARQSLVVVCLVLCAVTGCSSSNSHPVSGAFCSDLKNGLSLFQLYQPVKSKFTPAEFAGRAYGYAAISCPEQLQTNEGLRGFLKAWGVDPDAPTS